MQLLVMPIFGIRGLKITKYSIKELNEWKEILLDEKEKYDSTVRKS